MRRILALVFLLMPCALRAEERLGYYRFPAIHGDTVIFSAEGDLWRVARQGGVATRLTTHPAEETNPAISPDGRTVAFSAAYEGPAEVYTMPIDGGLPVRHTFEGEGARVVGWTPKGEILYATPHYSGLPAVQLARIDPATDHKALVPLAQASDGSYTPDGKTLFFTRFAFQGSHTKRYRGGTAQSLWRFRDGDAEAVALTADFTGTSKEPMVWQGRVYFVSDRDGTMNLWSMAADTEKGGDLRQHTFHKGWDAASPDLSEGRIVYRLGADLRIFDIASNQDAPLTVHLVSDFDQMREQWVKEPMDFLSVADFSPTGDRIALTARGQVFVVPVKKGRIVEVTRKPGVRYREARFLPDGKSVLALSDETGEVEVWKFPANGVGKPEQLTSGGKVLRWEAVPSPDGRYIAHHDKDQQLWLLDTRTKKQTRIATSADGEFQDLSWSPDSRWLAYAVPGANTFTRIFLHRAETGATVPLTSDRFNSGSPAWSRDGQWIYFLSDRHLRSLVESPWGSRQPDPFLTATNQIFGVALKKDARSPFQPPDELHPPKEEDEEEAETEEDKDGEEAKKKTPKVEIDLDRLAERLFEVPVPPGNYEDLTANDERLFWVSVEPGTEEEKASLLTVAFDPEKTEPATVVEEVDGYALSADGEKLLVQKEDAFYVFDAGETGPEELEKAQVDLSGWNFSFNPREQWQQMFREAWRLERDYFYDVKMHGLDWPAMLEKYRPLSLRVTSRGELDDLLAQMVSELSALHTFVGGGQYRKGEDKIEVASLGATLARDETAGGFRVERLYRWDPDLPSAAPPLAAPGVNVGEGDVIESINGIETLSVTDPAALLRNQADRQVLLKAKDGKTRKSRDVVVVPVSPARMADLRYGDWEISRRLAVEEKGKGQIGYVHLRAMGGEDYTSWARDFYPVFNRQGLILDVRNNEGGNIESWILAKLLRKAWFWWQPRVGEPYSNMPYAFRGHLVVLINEGTSSDGEAFAEGVRRLGLGKVIGTRTWGGEIWLTGSNILVDKGIATAAEFGVYGPEGSWLIEGHGVDPDVVVDNLPHATFGGGDAQLDAAIHYLEEKIKAEPVPVPKAPAYPNKAKEPEKPLHP
ncbi:MAG TPA: S41 family peptidase [Thermoanaerobaculia bacterium]|jgi:tricorn protease|nr:S41 family peptidase [Thermoanaerobaculia bacterium]